MRREILMKGVKSGFFKILCSTSLPLATTSLPLASTRWVRSTFSSHCPLSSRHVPLINLSNIDNFCQIAKIILGTLRIEPGAAGSGSRNTDRCATYATPTSTSIFELRKFCLKEELRNLNWKLWNSGPKCQLKYQITRQTILRCRVLAMKKF